MNKYFLTLIFFLGGLLIAKAQSKEDSLFIQQMVESSPKLIEGKTYFFETDKQQSSREYGKSLLVKEKDTPVFDYREKLTNGLPYAEFGNKPIKFKNVKVGKVKVGETNVPCFILSFSCGKENYRAYEFAESLLRARYDLIEADFLNKLNQLLTGKTLYTKSANWLQYNEDELNSNLKTVPVREGTCKYCPVTVTRVVNDYDDKYLVLFKPQNQDDEYCFGNVVFDKGDRSSLSFTRYFTFTNPQDAYPDISQERWEQIMAQKVRKGFTPDEVKVAYGKPDEVYTEDDDETWIYYNLNKKDYKIVFKEGIVEKIASLTSTYY
ncbi:MAG: hypothetical protein LBV72_08645 [Tannerella sp.]|nr:hypothetical protein [Tannerella sp.]